MHTATVADVADHAIDMASPINPKTLGETTTRYDGRDRPVASTTWLVALGAVDHESPPIAVVDDVSAADGLRAQHLYDDNLTGGTGLDSAAGLSYTKMAGGSGSARVSLTATIAKPARVLAIRRHAH